MSDRFTSERESFTYFLSHELRSPLWAIREFSKILAEDFAEPLDEMGREYVQRIVVSTQRVDALIRDMSLFVLIPRDTVSLDPMDLNGVVAEARRQCEKELDAAGARLEVEEPLPNARGNFDLGVQGVEQILLNAAKYIEPGETPILRVAGETRGDRIRLWVKDNGIGIAPDHQERIFDLFERLHGYDAYPGTGIGLAIVRAAVACMGGEAGVESSPGEGSRFWIELPKA
jgi:signal transduction histidine kinase